MENSSSTINPSVFEQPQMNLQQPSTPASFSQPSLSAPGPVDIGTNQPNIPSTGPSTSGQTLSDILQGSGGNSLFDTPSSNNEGMGAEPDFDLSDDEEEGLGEEPEFKEDTLESILPLSGKAKETGLDSQLLSGECTDLLKKLGINTSSVEKLCSQTLYDQVINVKNNFNDTLNKYREKIGEINTDINVLQNALLNDDLEIESIQNIENGINNIKEKRDSIMEEFKSLILLHKSISAMTDSIFEVRSDLLAALKTLSDKIDQGETLTPSGMDEDTVSVLQKNKLGATDLILQKSETMPTEAVTIIKRTPHDKNEKETLTIIDEADLSSDDEEDGGEVRNADDILRGLSIEGLDLGTSDDEGEESSGEEEDIF